MNSASQVSDAEGLETQQVMSFHDWHNENYGKHGYLDPDSLAGRISNFFDGIGTRERQEYETYVNNYLANLNNRNEAKATQSARAWDEYMSSTAYSRAIKDLERAGVNPYMIVNSGSSPSTTVGSASKASYQTSKPGLQDSKGSGKGRDLALIVLAIARIAAALA